MIALGIDSHDLSQSGWGVLFAPDEANAAAVYQALAPLLEARRQQAEPYYHEYYGDGLPRPGERKNAWLARHGASPGPLDPQAVPYHLLIVGSPERISFRFQQDLALHFAVGRIHFDTAAEYAHYAASVLRAEGIWQPQRALFFGAQHASDQHTALLAQRVLVPLTRWAREQGQWEVEAMMGERAGKEDLVAVLSDPTHPPLAILAGHGLAYPAGDPLQRERQGALLCREWPGLGQPVPPTGCFTADDIPPQADLTGMIWVQYASYSVGADTVAPQLGKLYPTQAGQAPVPFVSRLAQRLLSHPAGGALAVVGLVGPLWSYADSSEKTASRQPVFQEMMARLGKGESVGAALDPLRALYAEMALQMADAIEESRWGAPADSQRLAAGWAIVNDTRNLAIFGDPAARLAIASYDSVNAQKAVKSRVAPSKGAPAMTPVAAEFQQHVTRLPTFLYPYLLPEQSQLLTVRLRNDNYDRAMTVRVEAVLEGYSDAQKQEIQLAANDGQVVTLRPPLLPDARARLARETQTRLSIRVRDEKGGVVWEQSQPLWLMDVATPVLALRDPTNGEWQDFSPYLGLFITPDDPAVRDLLTAVSAPLPPEEAQVDSVARFLYERAYERLGLSHTGEYINRHTEEAITLRPLRRPGQTMAEGRANSLAAALLFATFLEAEHVAAAVVLTPPRALVAWQPMGPDERWRYFAVDNESRAFDAGLGEADALRRRYFQERPPPGQYPTFIRRTVADMRQTGIRPLTPDDSWTP